MAEKGKDNTLQDALQRILDNKPQVEVTKLPAEDPKPKKGQGWPEGSEWPEHLYCDSKKYPWLSKVKAGDEVFLIVRAKVDSITTREDAKEEEPKVSGTLTLLEIGKWGAK